MSAKKLAIATGLTLGLASVVSTTAFAVPITSAADAALTGATVMTFESETAGTYTSYTASSGVNFSAAQTFSIAGDYAGSYNTRGALHISNLGYQFQTLGIDFGGTVSAFGFLWGASDSSWTLNAYDALNSLIESTVVPAVVGSNAGDFFGLAAGGITHATITQNFDGIYAGGGVDYVFLDNLSFVRGSTTSVPEPASLGLLGLGLVGLGFVRRKRNQ